MSKSRERWLQIEAKGMKRFVLIRGLVGWGGLMAVAFMIVDYFHWKRLADAGVFSSEEAHAIYLSGMSVGIAICLVGGLAFGIITWWAIRLMWRIHEGRKPRSTE
ncbi:MAG TPA: hypothetical protein VHT23_08425 [Gemmatimonadaceae bacterium]|nr:hypothetical protein [Gemmatimonadaceae bacterium]